MLTGAGKPVALGDIRSSPYAIKRALWPPLKTSRENQCFSVKPGSKASGHWTDFSRCSSRLCSQIVVMMKRSSKLLQRRLRSSNPYPQPIPQNNNYRPLLKLRASSGSKLAPNKIMAISKVKHWVPQKFKDSRGGTILRQWLCSIPGKRIRMFPFLLARIINSKSSTTRSFYLWKRWSKRAVTRRK